MKKVLSVIIILLLCALCIVGIFLLGSRKTVNKEATNLDNVQPIKESFRKEYVVNKTSIVIDEEFEGIIDSFNGLRVETLTVAVPKNVSAEELRKLQGSIITRDDIILGSVKAPFTGKIDRVILQGDLVLITVVQYEDMYVSFSLPQKYLSIVKLGANLLFKCNKAEYEGKVSYISQYMDNGSATINLEYNDPNLELLINSSVTITLETERLDDVILIPQNSIMSNSDGNPTVQILNKENKVEIVSIECGRVYNDMVVVTSGLSEGMRLVIDITNDASYSSTDMAVAQLEYYYA